MRNLRLNVAGGTRARVDDIVVMDHPLEVRIDIKPESDPAPISLLADVIIPVAILGSDDFDVGDVDPNSLILGRFDEAGAGVEHDAHLEDVNGDGSIDLLAHFRTAETGVGYADTRLCISGRTRSRIPFDRCEAIRIVP